MRLEGSLDTFSLPDILQLLAFTRKTGALRVTRTAADASTDAVVHVREGGVCGASSDLSRQALARRLVGAGLVDDHALSAAVDRVRSEPGLGLGRALHEAGAVSAEDRDRVAAEQATDAVSELLRWESGTFSFHVDEPDPDAVEVSLAIEEVVAEGRRRMEVWPTLSERVPGPGGVLGLASSPSGDTSCTKQEWLLLSLVDGHRSVADLVSLTGWGEFAAVTALAELVDRGLVVQSGSEATGGVAALLRRQDMLASLETAAAAPVEPASATTADHADEPSLTTAPAPVPTPAAPVAAELPEMSDAPAVADEPAPHPAEPSVEPEAGDRRAPVDEPAAVASSEAEFDLVAVAPAAERASISVVPDPLGVSLPSPRTDDAPLFSSLGGGTSTEGSSARQTEPAATGPLSDALVNKSMLLRLIAGVRSL